MQEPATRRRAAHGDTPLGGSKVAPEGEDNRKARARGTVPGARGAYCGYCAAPTDRTPCATFSSFALVNVGGLADVLGRGADLHRVGAGLRHPRRGRLVERREVARRQLERERLRLARGERLRLREALELDRRLRHRLAGRRQVELHDLAAGDLARVLDRHRRGQAGAELLAAQLEARVGERGVGQSEPERVGHLHALRRVVAVADEDVVFVGHLRFAVAAPEAAAAPAAGCRGRVGAEDASSRGSWRPTARRCT